MTHHLAQINIARLIAPIDDPKIAEFVAQLEPINAHTGHGQIVDADLSGYFDSIPHSDLLKSVARRIVDGAMLHLIKMWLEVPVEETDEKGNKHRSTRNRDEGRGTPQGAPITPRTQKITWLKGSRRYGLGRC